MGVTDSGSSGGYGALIPSMNELNTNVMIDGQMDGYLQKLQRDPQAMQYLKNNPGIAQMIRMKLQKDQNALKNNIAQQRADLAERRFGITQSKEQSQEEYRQSQEQTAQEKLQMSREDRARKIQEDDRKAYIENRNYGMSVARLNFDAGKADPESRISGLLQQMTGMDAAVRVAEANRAAAIKNRASIGGALDSKYQTMLTRLLDPNLWSASNTAYQVVSPYVQHIGGKELKPDQLTDKNFANNLSLFKPEDKELSTAIQKVVQLVNLVKSEPQYNPQKAVTIVRGMGAPDDLAKNGYLSQNGLQVLKTGFPGVDMWEKGKGVTYYQTLPQFVNPQAISEAEYAKAWGDREVLRKQLTNAQGMLSQVSQVALQNPGYLEQNPQVKAAVQQAIDLENFNRNSPVYVVGKYGDRIDVNSTGGWFKGHDGKQYFVPSYGSQVVQTPDGKSIITGGIQTHSSIAQDDPLLAQQKKWDVENTQRNPGNNVRDIHSILSNPGLQWSADGKGFTVGPDGKIVYSRIEKQTLSLDNGKLKDVYLDTKTGYHYDVAELDRQATQAGIDKGIAAASLIASKSDPNPNAIPSVSGNPLAKPGSQSDLLNASGVNAGVKTAVGIAKQNAASMAPIQFMWNGQKYTIDDPAVIQARNHMIPDIVGVIGKVNHNLTAEGLASLWDEATKKVQQRYHPVTIDPETGLPSSSTEAITGVLTQGIPGLNELEFMKLVVSRGLNLPKDMSWGNVFNDIINGKVWGSVKKDWPNVAPTVLGRIQGLGETAIETQPLAWMPAFGYGVYKNKGNIAKTIADMINGKVEGAEGLAAYLGNIGGEAQEHPAIALLNVGEAILFHRLTKGLIQPRKIPYGSRPVGNMSTPWGTQELIRGTTKFPSSTAPPIPQSVPLSPIEQYWKPSYTPENPFLRGSNIFGNPSEVPGSSVPTVEPISPGGSSLFNPRGLSPEQSLIQTLMDTMEQATMYGGG